MSENTIDPTKVECARCGRDGLPPVECENCHGNAEVRSRAYTLSDHRSGRAPKEDREKHLGPRIINLPGSAGPGGS